MILPKILWHKEDMVGNLHFEEREFTWKKKICTCRVPFYLFPHKTLERFFTIHSDAGQASASSICKMGITVQPIPQGGWKDKIKSGIWFFLPAPGTESGLPTKQPVLCFSCFSLLLPALQALEHSLPWCNGLRCCPRG